MFGLTILGSNAATPAHGRHPTAQALTLGNTVILIDCGEGTQMQLTAYKVRRSRLHHIFISHLHGDHYFGLPGLINSLALMGRTDPLYLFGPAPLMPILQSQFDAANTTLPFDLVFKPIESAGLLHETEAFTVQCFAVQHRIECWGFLFTERKLPRKLLPAAAIAAGVPQTFFQRLQLGENYVTAEGNTIENHLVTKPNAPCRSYAYCADTIYDPSLCDIVKAVRLLYHEATYLHDLADRAKARFHSTAHQAACIARDAGARRLIIGHFSSKYEKVDALLDEARLTFSNTDPAIEGVTFRID